MTSVIRLDSVYPSLAERFRRAPSTKRRIAALVACELAASATELIGQSIDLALDALRRGSAEQSSLRQLLEGEAAHFDEEYLRIREELDKPEGVESLKLFSKARAASALAFALVDDPEQLHDSIYEALMAIDHPSDLVRSLEEILR